VSGVSEKRLAQVADMRRQGMSYRQISANTGLAVNSVRAYLWRARKADLLDVVTVPHCPHCGATKSRWIERDK